MSKLVNPVDPQTRRAFQLLSLHLAERHYCGLGQHTQLQSPHVALFWTIVSPSEMSLLFKIEFCSRTTQDTRAVRPTLACDATNESIPTTPTLRTPQRSKPCCASKVNAHIQKQLRARYFTRTIRNSWDTMKFIRSTETNYRNAVARIPRLHLAGYRSHATYTALPFMCPIGSRDFFPVLIKLG